VPRSATWALPFLGFRLAFVSTAFLFALAVAPVPGHALEPAIDLVFESTLELVPPHFGRPTAVAAGPLGRLYIGDAGRGTVLRITPDGKVLFEFAAPTGSPALQPIDLEVTGFKVYVLDAQSSGLLRYSDTGSFLDVLRSFESSRGQMPRALSVDASGRVLLCLTPLHQVMVLDESSRTETIVGGLGSRAGEMSRPTGVAFARDGTYYVADTGNARLQRFSAVGNFEAAFSDSLGEPRGLAVGPGGEVYAADARQRAVHLFGASGIRRATLGLAKYQPVDVAAAGDTLWTLSASPPALVRARVVRGR
jgi:DNA-binding beta-propeller fold protein YncE